MRHIKKFNENSLLDPMNNWDRESSPKQDIEIDKDSAFRKASADIRAGLKDKVLDKSVLDLLDKAYNDLTVDGEFSSDNHDYQYEISISKKFKYRG